MTRGRHPVEPTRPAPGTTLERAALAAQVLRERLGMALEEHRLLRPQQTSVSGRLDPTDVDALVGTVMALVADDTDLRTAGHLRRASRAVLGLNPDPQMGSDYRGGLRRAARYLHTLADRYDRAHGVALPATTDPVEAEDAAQLLGEDSDWEYADVWTVGSRRPHRLYRDQAAVRAARERDADPADPVEPAPQGQVITQVHLSAPNGTGLVFTPRTVVLHEGDSLTVQTDPPPPDGEPLRDFERAVIDGPVGVAARGFTLTPDQVAEAVNGGAKLPSGITVHLSCEPHRPARG